ncbi:hypothetical protein QVN85_10230 [Oscillibacter valericigenes]|nr:hypothetical protein [Oscillibacter valericigenes]
MDTAKLRNAIRDFAFYSKPSNGDGSAQCTVRDINKVIENLTKVLTTFVDELESEE